MRKLMLVAMMVGVVLVVMGVQETMLSSLAKSQPQEISCSNLAASGPGGNVHVLMSKFVFYDDAAIIVTARRSKRWKHVWIPAVPLDGPWARDVQAKIAAGKHADIQPPREKVVLVKAEVRSEDALEEFLDSDSVTGMIINEIETIDARERREIEEGMPGMSLKSAYMLEAGRAPAGSGKLIGFFGGGAGLFAAPLIMFGVRRQRGRTTSIRPIETAR
jgi:hypothetical protein